MARPAALTIAEGWRTLSLAGDTRTSATMSTAPYDAIETASTTRRRRRASDEVGHPSGQRAARPARPTKSKDSAWYAKVHGCGGLSEQAPHSRGHETKTQGKAPPPLMV